MITPWYFFTFKLKEIMAQLIYHSDFKHIYMEL